MRRISDFNFLLTYDYASLVRNATFHSSDDNYSNNLRYYLEELPSVEIQKFKKPHKESLLHSYINYAIDEDTYCLGENGFDEYWNFYREVFLDYGIYEFDEINFKSNIIPDDLDIVYDKVDNIWKDKIKPCIIDEVFTLLFPDRKFLLQFNLEISGKISTLLTENYPNILEKNGRISRCQKFPSWVEKAIFYRDKGHCALCLRDLTNSFLGSRNYHIDHIIPLMKHGSNDITNLQILCDSCNLSKKVDISTSSKYFMFY